MDIKYYILLIGGALIGLVLLHGFYLALKSRRQKAVAPVGTDDYRAPEQTKLEFESTPQSTLTVGREQPQVPEPPDDERLEPLIADMQANGSQNMQSAEIPPAEAPVRNRRVIIPGKRTEPTVPRGSQMFDMGTQSDLKTTAESEAEPADVLVFWVVAKPDAELDGRELLDAFTSHGLQYDGNVFRKVDPNTGDDSFMVANGVEPGTFDLSDVDTLVTPRVVLLLPLVPDGNLTEAFEDMLGVAQDIADSLDAELKDEHMSDMSGQTIEHCRQRIRDFRRLSFRT